MFCFYNKVVFFPKDKIQLNKLSLPCALCLEIGLNYGCLIVLWWKFTLFFSKCGNMKTAYFYFFGIWFVLYWVLTLRRSKECWCLWFEQIEEHYSAQGLGIVGYFHANERFDDLELDSIAKNIGNHICRYFPQCAVLLVCNCYLGILKVHCLCLLLNFFFYHF